MLLKEAMAEDDNKSEEQAIVEWLRVVDRPVGDKRGRQRRAKNK